MKNLFIITVLFSMTGLAVAFYPSLPNANTETPINSVELETIKKAQQHPKIDVVFALDTTGSMSSMIQAAKEKIWSIATTLASSELQPEIRIGLVAYRDRGEDYVTKVIDLSSDLDSVFAELMKFKAAGGGDGPESVNQALNDAVNKISWDKDQAAFKVVFLVGDAPAHTDYQNDMQFPDILKMAKQKGITVNSIQCGEDQNTKHQWQQIAYQGSGEYLKVDQNGSAIASATPFDSSIAELSKKLESNRIFYGTEEVRAKLAEKTKQSAELYESASKTTLAKRAAFNSTSSGSKNLLGDSELLNDIVEGKVDITTVDTSLLPEAIAVMNKDERISYIKNKTKERSEIQTEIRLLSEKRNEFIRSKVAESNELEKSLDYQLFSTLKKQAKEKGISYEDSDMAL